MNDVSTLLGSVTELWCYPVKSMAGMRLDAVALAGGAVLGDRAFALIEEETGHVVSAKSVRKWPSLLNCRAVYVSDPRPQAPLPALRITLADGTDVLSSDPRWTRFSPNG